MNSLAIKATERLHRVQVNGRVEPLKHELDGYGTECIFYPVYGRWMGFYDVPQNPEVLEFIETACEYNEALFALLKWGPLAGYLTVPPYKTYLFSSEKLQRLAKEFAKMGGKEQDNRRDREKCPSLHAKLSGIDAVADLVIGLGQLGVDNTSFALLWCLYHLARNPAEQEKAYQEVVSVIGTASEDTSSQTPHFHSELPYLKGCIKEAMRLNPTALFLPRKLDRDTTLCGYDIPAQSVVMLWFSYLTSSEKYFTDPGVFRPQRWLKNETQEKIDPFASLPFGFGTRMCLGRRFADLTMIIGLAHILQNFRLEYVGNETLKGIYQNWHIPEEEIPIMFVKRV